MSQRQFGKYRLITRLAKGGMAEIFLASTKGLAGFEKLVAIKRILPTLANQQAYIEMFLDEARIAARLNHRNVVQNYDLGVIDGQYFIAMEYLEGQSLCTLNGSFIKKSKKLPFELVVGIISQAAEGLHYAHTLVDIDGKPLRIVHRDVCPQNIFVLYDGNVKVVDFGIAEASLREAHTQAGTLKGKPAYISPERIHRKKLDGRSDVFSLGVVLWECLVGRRLFHRENHLELLELVAKHDAPSPRDFVPSLPVELECIVLRSLARDRDSRYQSARDFRNDLSRFVRKSGRKVDSVAIGNLMQRIYAKSIEAMREQIVDAQTSTQHKSDSKVADVSHHLFEAVDLLPSQTMEPTPSSLIESSSIFVGHGSSLLRFAALLVFVVFFVGFSEIFDPLLKELGVVTNELESGSPALPISIRIGATTSPDEQTIVQGYPKTAKTKTNDKTKRKNQPRMRNADRVRNRRARRNNKRPPLESIDVGPSTKGDPIRARNKVTRKRNDKAESGKNEKDACLPGLLHLVSTPWTDIYHKGRKLGKTPLFDVELPSGKVYLRAVNKKSGIDERFSVDIQPGKRVEKSLSFP